MKRESRREEFDHRARWARGRPPGAGGSELGRSIGGRPRASALRRIHEPRSYRRPDGRGGRSPPHAECRRGASTQGHGRREPRRRAPGNDGRAAAAPCTAWDRRDQITSLVGGVARSWLVV